LKEKLEREGKSELLINTKDPTYVGMSQRSLATQNSDDVGDRQRGKGRRYRERKRLKIVLCRTQSSRFNGQEKGED